MRLLALETATAATAVALGDDDDLAEHVEPGPGRHTEMLAPSIVALLAAKHWSPQDLDGVVVDVGPGLFTGLRVGIATAKGLALGTGCGLYAVTSTDVLARTALDAGITGLVAAVVDARRREVFWSLYDVGADGFAGVGDVEVAAPADVAARLEALDAPVTLVGDGALAHPDVFDGAGRRARDGLVVPSPASAIRHVRAMIAAGAAPSTHREVHPWYLREADAVANFQVRGTGPAA